MNIDEKIIKIESFVSYFENCSKTNPSFIPQFQIAKITLKLFNSPNFSPQEIVDKINELNHQEHYNGSGWYDFINQIAFFLSDSENKWIVDMENENKIIKDSNVPKLRGS